MGRSTLSKSSKRNVRRLADVLPAAEPGLDANFCRNPNCPNFGRSADRDPSRKHHLPAEAMIGRYILVGSAGETALKCAACGRIAGMLSNVALAAEISRLRTANGILRPEACPTKNCANHGRPACGHPAEYYSHGLTKSGTQRLRCKRCRATLSLGERLPRQRRKPARGKKPVAPINKDIVLDLVNRGALRAIMRKCGIGAETLYDRIDFIHARMIAFEAFKLQNADSDEAAQAFRFDGALCSDMMSPRAWRLAG